MAAGARCDEEREAGGPFWQAGVREFCLDGGTKARRRFLPEDHLPLAIALKDAFGTFRDELVMP